MFLDLKRVNRLRIKYADGRQIQSNNSEKSLKKLYLVQHGKALSKEENPDRPLSQEGNEESFLSAAILVKSNVKIHQIWHSSKLRAIQTAHIFVEIANPEEGLVEKNNLNPNDNIDGIVNELNQTDKDIMIIGHLPYLNNLALFLLKHDQLKDQVYFVNSGVVCLVQSDNLDWKLHFCIPPMESG